MGRFLVKALMWAIMAVMVYIAIMVLLGELGIGHCNGPLPCIEREF